MKRPALYITILFIAIISSTALVSTAISGICRSFYENSAEKSITVKTTPVDKSSDDEFKQASIRLSGQDSR